MLGSFVFIDAAYLNLIAKHFFDGRPPPYDIRELATNLAKEQNLLCNGAFYYTAPPYQSPKQTPDEARRKANYDKFISKLRKLPSFIIREGRCQKTTDGFVQKGVDTHLTMDLMTTALSKQPEAIILIACDTDFVPVLNKIRSELSVSIILYYFTDRVRGSRFSMSNHMLTACDKAILLTKRHFTDCLLSKTN